MPDRRTASAGGLVHAALLYRTHEELAAGVGEFVRSGISAGQAVLVASVGDSLQLLPARLDGQGEMVTWLDLGSAGANPTRVIAAFRSFASAHPGTMVRCVQEPHWDARPPAAVREGMRQEALLNLAVTEDRVSVLCGYDAGLAPGILAAAERTHPVVIRDGRWQPSPSYHADVLIPAEWDQPLAAPPGGAALLTYREDQGHLRQFVTACAAQAGLATGRTTDLVIAVGELAANTLVHTTGPGTVAIWATGGELLCQVHDGGRITDPLAGTHRPGPTSPARGRGLWIVHQLCDLVETRTGPAGTTTRVHMRLPA